MIKTSADYQEALAEVRRLAALNPKPGDAIANRLSVLAVLLEVYEREHFVIDNPTPIEAIRFRMDQLHLTPRDLQAYVGSRSKVSEVLSGRRPLTLRMIKELHAALNIPLKVLLKDSPTSRESKAPTRVAREIVRRGWVSATSDEVASRPDAVVARLASLAGGEASPLAALWRGSLHQHQAASIDPFALKAWLTRVLVVARSSAVVDRTARSNVSTELMTDTVRLSPHPRGPLLAQEFLGQKGIALVIEPQLPRMRVDGAAALDGDGIVIGLTLRYDRVDHFWYTLLHELGHAQLHLTAGSDFYVDNLDVTGQTDIREIEADEAAKNAIISQESWRRSDAFSDRTPESIVALAAQLGVNPALLAGMLRRETGDYRLLSQLVGHRQVRSLFRGLRWQGRT